MKSDIEIAQCAKMKKITEIAEMIGIDADELELYGNYKAKISPKVWERIKNNKDGKLVLVTAINPTPAGEGKTTTTIGLGQALHKIGKRAVIALREPSLGPCMGLKGGAAGGGYSQVMPMDEINLHFTGDIHAISSAHALLSAAIDNHIFRGNSLEIDTTKITWKRSVDMNDRALRNIIVGLGGENNGHPREDGFIITVASEIMAILCLSSDLMDLKQRLSKIIIGYNIHGSAVTCGDLKVQGAMTLLLKDAIKPNLVQTLENTPCIIHGGPFANIAHGCNSIIATKLGLKLSDYLITEAGFGADLGAEKFLDIKCRFGGLRPELVVIVATVRSLKYNGGISKENLKEENLDALKNGAVNLEKHIENMKKFGLNTVVAINVFDTDTKEELSYIKEVCASLKVPAVECNAYSGGGEGSIELAKKVVEVIETGTPKFEYLYDENMPIKEKIEVIVKQIYGGEGAEYSTKAQKEIARLETLNLDKLPICMAKTQYSLSDNPDLLGRPRGFKVMVRDIKISNGAGFIVAITGDIMTMPGLPKTPSACNIDINEEGIITGLF